MTLYAAKVSSGALIFVKRALISFEAGAISGAASNGRITSVSTPLIPQRAVHSRVNPSRQYACRSFRPSCGRMHQFVRQIHQATALKHRAFIALGSNLGDKVSMIEEACKKMEQSGKIRILRTSSLWETKAMYVLDQDKFVNGVCEVETSLSPMELLDMLQSIEQGMHRVKVVDKGPRNIDLDILLFDEQVFMNERLQIPHKLMLEREFVLRPLCELIPEQSLPPHVSQPAGSFQYHLANLPRTEDPISPFTPLAPGVPSIATNRTNRSTRVMTILNITPDSFSDGGKLFDVSKQQLGDVIKHSVKAGTTIFDLGGQSTRPGSVQVTAEEELSRIIPALELLCNLELAEGIAISIDTYRAKVAEKAIEAGAHIVNDVSGGLLDEAMLPTVARLGCTVCLMHMRGTPETMNELAHYPNGVVETVGHELLERVREAEAAGIRRWRIILDPGIGFAKTQEHNVELLRRLDELRKYPGLEGLPWLVGTSRKGFIGKITGVSQADERIPGTAVAVTAAIQGGADIVRVHDAKEMGQVVRMADAIWRI